MSKETKEPIIQEYLDYREFLRHYYEYRKITGKFSYQIWANELRITSKGYLRLLVAGKRPLGDSLLPNFYKFFKFSKQEEDFFTNLIKFNQAKNLEVRTLFLAKLKSGQKLETNFIGNTYEYLSNEWLPRIHVLLGQEKLTRTSDSIAKSLKLSVKKTAGFLEKLKSLGYADHKEDEWFAKHPINSVPDQINDVAVQSFHKKSLERAIESIDSEPKSRHLNATYFIIPEEQLSEVRERINNFSKSLLSEYGKEQIEAGKASRLYQVNINAIPMSDQLIHSSNECAKGSSTLLETLEVQI